MLKPVLFWVLLFTSALCSGQIRLENIKMDSFSLTNHMAGKRLYDNVYRVVHNRNNIYNLSFPVGYKYYDNNKKDFDNMYFKNVFSFDLHTRQVVGDFMQFECSSDTGKMFLRFMADTDTSAHRVKNGFGGMCKGDFNGKCVILSPQGHIMEEKYYVDNVLHGLYRSWYDNDSLRIWANYNHGKLDGEYKEYGGYNYWLKNYRNGLLHGESRSYFKGKLYGITYYENNKAIRGMEWFYNGKLNRLWANYPKEMRRTWNEDGEMVGLRVEDSVQLRWNNEGVLMYGKTYDKKSGTWIEKDYWDNGRLKTMRKHKTYYFSPIGEKLFYDREGKRVINSPEREDVTVEDVGYDREEDQSSYDDDTLALFYLPYSVEGIGGLNRQLNDSLHGIRIKKKDKGRHKIFLEIIFSSTEPVVMMNVSFPDHVFVSEELKAYLTKMIERSVKYPYLFSAFVTGPGAGFSRYVSMTGYIVLE